MAKLRAAREGHEAKDLADLALALGCNKKAVGLALVKDLMRAGNWNDAILAAAKFPDLGDQAEAIQRGREAIQRPAFQRQLKRDPEALIEAAKAAMLKRWPL